MSHPLFELTFIEEISLSPSSNSATDKQTEKNKAVFETDIQRIFTGA